MTEYDSYGDKHVFEPVKKPADDEHLRVWNSMPSHWQNNISTDQLRVAIDAVDAVRASIAQSPQASAGGEISKITPMFLANAAFCIENSNNVKPEIRESIIDTLIKASEELSRENAPAASIAPLPVVTAGGEREVIVPLKEPVSIKKALLGGRIVKVDTEMGGMHAVFLVNIQLTGWSQDKDYADGYAKGFNTAAEWMQSALAARIGDEAHARDAARWRAFIACDRIRILGTAGYSKTDPYGNPKTNYRHFGAEFWSVHSATEPRHNGGLNAKQILEGFADAAIRAQQPEQGEK